MSATHKARFLESLQRCQASAEFIPTFYRRFLDSSDEVRFRFRNTDFDRQNAMLLRSLELAAAATQGDPAGLRELNERAESHDRYHLKVKPELYDYWLEAIIVTAGEFDPEWSAQIESSWRRILGLVIHHMTSRY